MRPAAARGSVQAETLGSGWAGVAGEQPMGGEEVKMQWARTPANHTGVGWREPLLIQKPKCSRQERKTSGLQVTPARRGGGR